MKKLNPANYLICLLFIPFFLLSCDSDKGKDPQILKAGAVWLDITPPLGYPVHGVPSEGALDPITVKTLVLAQGREIAAFVMVDLFFIDYDLGNIVRELASGKTGIPFSNICVAATHTHADPTYIHDFEEYFRKKTSGKLSKEDEESYIGQLIRSMVESVAEANDNLKPVNLQSGIAKTSGLVFNRRHLMSDGTVKMNGGFLNPDVIRAVGPVDPDLGIVLLSDKETDQPVASLTTFAMQAATIGSTKKFSGGFPYFLEQGLKQKFGNQFVSIFAEGTCADVNHWDVTKPGPQIGYEMATRPVGEKLATVFLQYLPDLTSNNANLTVRSKVIQLPLQMYSAMDLEWAKSYKGDPPNFIVSTRAKRILHLEKLRNRFGENIPMEIQVFRLNDETAIIALPGQVFVELGLALKEASPFPTTLIVTLANSHEECIPPRKAYTEGSYEIIYSRVEAGGGEKIIETALELLNELKSGR